MTLQAKLTLGTVLLATVIVAIYPVVYLGSIMDLRFSDAYAEAGRVRNIAVEYVTDALNSHPETPVNDVLASDRLTQQLETEVGYHKEIVEVAVVDADNNILADNFPDRRGQTMPPIKSVAQLEPLVHAGWISKVKVLWSHNIDHYEVDGNPLGPPPIVVRVVVQPATIRDIMQPDITKSAGIALISVVCAICLTFLFSAFAFRPLGRLRRQLDLLASGEYEPEKTAFKRSKDEVSIMASKVSLLGERLRGAQFEMSDLRGNIDRFLKDLEDAVLIFNRENRLVFASGSVSRFLGKERAALSGERIADIFPPSTNLGFLIAQAAESGMGIRNRRIPLTSPVEGAEAGPSVLLSVDWLEAQTGARTGLLVRLRDPEAQRQIGRELQTADRLAAISRISGGVAHEVKNPLNAILLHVEVARTTPEARRDGCIAADGSDLAGNPAPGPRGEDLSRLYPPGGIEIPRGSPARRGARDRGVDPPPGRSSEGPHDRRAGLRGRGCARGPRHVQTGSSKCRGQRHSSHERWRRSAPGVFQHGRHRGDPHRRYRAWRSPRSCATKSSGFTSPPNKAEAALGSQ